MRLSEAIRLGSMLKPQGFGNYLSGGGTCAIGAALEAVGLAMDRNECEPFPVLRIEGVTCPACAQVDTFGWVIATHLNDKHRWTRDQIADWVAGVEAAQELQAQPVGDFACCSPSSAAQSVRERA